MPEDLVASFRSLVSGPFPWGPFLAVAVALLAAVLLALRARRRRQESRRVGAVRAPEASRVLRSRKRTLEAIERDLALGHGDRGSYVLLLYDVRDPDEASDAAVHDQLAQLAPPGSTLGRIAEGRFVVGLRNSSQERAGHEQVRLASAIAGRIGGRVLRVGRSHTTGPEATPHGLLEEAREDRWIHASSGCAPTDSSVGPEGFLDRAFAEVNE